MNMKIIVFGFIIALVLSAGIAPALSNSGGGDWDNISALSSGELLLKIKKYVVENGEHSEVYGDIRSRYELDFISKNKYYYVEVQDFENDGIMDAITLNVARGNTDLTDKWDVSDISKRHIQLRPGRDPSILELKYFCDINIDGSPEIYQFFSVLDYGNPEASDYDKGLVNENLVDERPNSIKDPKINGDFRELVSEVYEMLIITPTPTPEQTATPVPTSVSTVMSTPTPEKTPTPTPTPFASIPPLSNQGSSVIVAAAVIAIIIIAGIGVSRKEKKSKSTKPKPPAEPPNPATEPAKPEPVIEPAPTKLESSINIASAFGYKGAAIVHKIKVENFTPEPVSDIKIHLFVPPEVFLLKDLEKRISLLKPGESKTTTFEIRPTGECGDCELSGRVTYYDYASRKTKEVDIPPKTLSIVCPLLKAKKIDRAGWKDTVSRLIQAEESTKEIQIPAETLFNMTSRVIEDMNMFMLEPEVTSSPQLFNGVVRFYAEGVKDLKYAAQIEVVGSAKKSKLILKAWAEKEEALTGFYHGMLDEIEKRVQVKDYIDDSIVQQFYHIGDRIGAVVKDSVVQRSTLGVSEDKE